MRIYCRYMHLLAVVLSALTVQAWAAAGDTTKDDWFGKFQKIVPIVACDSFLKDDKFKNKMQAADIDNAKCMTLVSASYERCRTRYYSSMPATFDSTEASQWGRKMGECIGADFVGNNLVGINAPAATATPSTTSSSTPAKADTMTKDVWLGQLKTLAPAMICEGFFEDATLKVKMKKKNIDYDKCVGLIPASIDKCQAQFYDKLPNTMTKELIIKWGYKVGECIGADFVMKNLLASPSDN